MYSTVWAFVATPSATTASICDASRAWLFFTALTPRILAAAAASRNAMPRRATSSSCPAWCQRRLDPYFAAIYDGRSCTS